jgi:hypothetical protein
MESEDLPDRRLKIGGYKMLDMHLQDTSRFIRKPYQIWRLQIWHLKSGISKSGVWRPQYLLLNLAFGGQLGRREGRGSGCRNAWKSIGCEFANDR